MVKRQRDYRAEEQRRNELARQRGFTTRAAERGAKARQDFTVGGFASHTDYTTVRASAESWSDLHSLSEKSQFNPRWPADRIAAYSIAYDVDRKDRTSKQRKRNLRDYLTRYYPGEYPNAKDKSYWENY